MNRNLKQGCGWNVRAARVFFAARVLVDFPRCLLFLLALFLAPCPSFSSLIDYQPPAGGGSGAVDSVNGKTGVVVLSSEDMLVRPASTNLASLVDAKVDKQYAEADKGKYLAIDETTFKVKPVPAPTESSHIKFYKKVPSEMPVIDGIGASGFAYAIYNTKIYQMAWDANGYNAIVDNTDGGIDIKVVRNASGNSFWFEGSSTNAYSVIIIQE